MSFFKLREQLSLILIIWYSFGLKGRLRTGPSKSEKIRIEKNAVL